MKLTVPMYFTQYLNSRLEAELNKIEKKHHISQRWLPTDSNFIEYKCLLASNQSEQILQQICVAGQRRLFLLNLKRKYAGKIISLICYTSDMCYNRFPL